MKENKTLCIVVPYRNREHHLKEFLPWMETILNEQKIDYHILIVEQEEGKAFNRGKLLNVGYDYTNRGYDNYCFHDVDMLPVVADYTYCDSPTHLAVEVEQFGWRLAYNEYFGGVTIFDRESFGLINGYANEYWGWGAEDDDVFGRCLEKNVNLKRKSCKFRSLSHERHIDPEDYNKNLNKLNEFKKSASSSMIEDGLNTLKYEVLETEKIAERVERIKTRI